MRVTAGRLLLPLTLLVGFALACNWSTANIKDVKISKDNDGKDTISQVKPGDNFYVVAHVGNNPGKVKMKFRLLYEDVNGKKKGDSVTGFTVDDKPLEVSGDGRAAWSMTMASGGVLNGKYRAEITMLNEKDDVKGTESATFEVTGYSDGGSD